MVHHCRTRNNGGSYITTACQARGSAELCLCTRSRLAARQGRMPWWSLLWSTSMGRPRAARIPVPAATS